MKIIKYLVIACIPFIYTACKVPSSMKKKENKTVPESFATPQDSINTARVQWRKFFTDSTLTALIDTALKNNQDLNIMLQQIYIAKNEVRVKKGAYLPFVNGVAGAGVGRTPQYTSQGASDANNDITPGQKVPVILPNYVVGLSASWELDIWKRLRNSKKAAMFRYLSTIEGKNFMVTSLIAEIAHQYYELMALDNQLEILKKNIEVQQNALQIVIQEKNAAKVTELAVRRFEAEVLKNQSRQYYIVQNIVEAENRINYLLGRFPQPIVRNSKAFIELMPDSIHAGIPSQLLQNRTDVRQAEQDLASTKLDVKAAKASYYPMLTITAGVGYQAFNPSYLLESPASLIYTVAGQLVAPLVNRNAIKANYYSANSRQVQAAYEYERTILNAYIEVANQLSNMNNLKKSYDLKDKQVQALNQSIDISIRLFRSARADYMEILLTQRDALEARFELIETKKLQMMSRVSTYQALGGGWN